MQNHNGGWRLLTAPNPTILSACSLFARNLKLQSSLDGSIDRSGIDLEVH